MNVRGPAQRRRARSPRVASSRGTPDEPVSRGAQAPTQDPLPWAGEPAAAVGRWDRRLGQPRANPIGRATIESCGHARGSGQQGGVSRSVLDLLGARPRPRLVRLAGLGASKRPTGNRFDPCMTTSDIPPGRAASVESATTTSGGSSACSGSRSVSRRRHGTRSNRRGRPSWGCVGGRSARPSS